MKEGIYVGRFHIDCLMSKCHLRCKQPNPHPYKVAKTERPDIPNKLNWELNVNKPNQVWSGDITYIWTGSRWIYLAVIIDLYARKIFDWAIPDHADTDLTIKEALEDTYHRQGKPNGGVFHSDQASQYK